MRMIVNNTYGHSAGAEYVEHDGSKRVFMCMDDRAGELEVLAPDEPKVWALAERIATLFYFFPNKEARERWGYYPVDAWNCLIGVLQGRWLGPECFMHDREAEYPDGPSCWNGLEWRKKFEAWDAYESAGIKELFEEGDPS